MAHEVSPEEIHTIGDWLRGKVPQCAASLGHQAEGDTTAQDAPPQAPEIVLQPYSTIPAYVTKDGSEIREMMHPGVHGNAAQSLAEATVHPGTQTHRHRHLKTEEIYHVISGNGLMTLGKRQFPVAPGDTVLILPGTPHCIATHGEIPLRILCCCSPAYDHADTELLEMEEGTAD